MEPRNGRTGQRTTTSRADSRAAQRKSSWVFPTIVIGLLVVGAVVWYLLHRSTMPRADRYQAVYVETGQVYFGKLKNIDGRYLRIEGAYVARAQDIPPNATEEQKATLNANVSLAKVSEQVYGPEDALEIRADKVIFWQDLKTDSKVTKAIEDAQ